MTRSTMKKLIIATAIVCGIAMVDDMATKTGAFADFSAEAEEVIAETETSLKTAFFEVVDTTGPKLTDTVEETETEPETDPTFFEVANNTEAETEPETRHDFSEMDTDLHDGAVKFYECERDHLDHAIQDYMATECRKAGIGWFYEYILCIAYQESSWNLECLTGPDTGLLQYRDYFWHEWCADPKETGDIWDPYAQIRVTVYWSARRLNAGWSLEETISAHKTGSRKMDAEYVQRVLGWLPKLIEE